MKSKKSHGGKGRRRRKKKNLEVQHLERWWDEEEVEFNKEGRRSRIGNERVMKEN